MADHTELKTLQSDDEARNRIEVSLWRCVQEIQTNNDTSNLYTQTQEAHDKRLRWTARVQNDFVGASRIFWPLVLAANESATPEQILGATDDQYLDNCRELVDEQALVIEIENPIPAPTP